MTDIVERLRAAAGTRPAKDEIETALLEAAEEIERLRAENEWMHTELKKVADLIGSDASKRP